MTSTHLAFVTTGDIEKIATSKRAFGMAHPLMDLGYRVTIVLEDTPNNRIRAELEAPRAEFAWFKSAKTFAELKAKRKILRDLAPDVVYVGSYGFRNMVAPFAPCRATYLVEHSELASAIKNRSKMRNLIDFTLEKLSTWVFDGQVCASRYLENYIKERLGKSRQNRVIYSPYAYSHASLLGEGAAQVSASDTKKILYMGTLARNYGILDILSAFKTLSKDRDDITLVVLGSGRDADAARESAKELGIDAKVDFRGYVKEEELPSYLSQADTFVAPLFPTIQDIARCPSKMFMYLPFEKPVVTTKIGEAEEFFGEEYEFYFEPGSADGMAQKLELAVYGSDNWSPGWIAADHEWTARAATFDDWLKSIR